jgi:hypothetical protein
MKTYEAQGGFWNDGNVWVCIDGQRLGELDPHFEVINKSPTGFAWGYGGSGPAQLAFAILADVIGVERASNPEMFQRFKFDVIGKLDKDKGFRITEDEVKAWLTANTFDCCAYHRGGGRRSIPCNEEDVR